MDNSVAATGGRCRVCLQKDVDMVALSLAFWVFAEEVTLSQMLKTCCAIEISTTDLKPQTLCNHCANTTEKLFTFRKTCQNTDRILQEELDGVNMKVEPDEVIIKGNHEEEVCGDDMKVQLDELIIKEEHEEDDHKHGLMATIKDELPDYVSISNTDDTRNTEKIVCKICQTYFTDWISLEHHLENCHRSVTSVCGQAFTSAGVLYEHRQAHEIPSTNKNVILKRDKSKRHQCRICKMSFKYPVELRNHCMTHATVKHYLCLYCGNKFSLSHRTKCEQTQSQHSRQHINKKTDNKASDSLKTEPLYGCSVCKQSYHQQKYLMNHKCIKTIQKSHKCSQCDKAFTSAADLKRHTLCHTGEKPYECSHCRKRFTRLSSMTVHKRIHTGKDLHDCSHCSKRFTTPQGLAIHIRTHTGEKPYKCPHCGKRFTEKSNLTIHERSHTDEKPYECSHCSKHFTRKCHLNRHKLIHTGEKTFGCSHCSRRFNRQIQLTNHERTHTGEKPPFKCSHCNKRYSQQSTLSWHERTHTGEKLFECSHCSKNFAHKHHLKSHMLTHTGEKPYECSHCSKRFTHKHHLKSHMLTHTGEKP